MVTCAMLTVSLAFEMDDGAFEQGNAKCHGRTQHDAVEPVDAVPRESNGGRALTRFENADPEMLRTDDPLVGACRGVDANQNERRIERNRGERRRGESHELVALKNSDDGHPARKVRQSFSERDARDCLRRRFGHRGYSIPRARATSRIWSRDRASSSKSFAGRKRDATPSRGTRTYVESSAEVSS